jgi:transcriptional activator of cad operon
MDRPTESKLRVGVWCVDAQNSQITRNGEVVKVEARTMRLLQCLAAHAGEVVSIDQLLAEVWPGVIVTADSVYQAVASLRRLLGDDPKQPAYIATAPRLGYRMIATVSPWTDEPTPTSAPVPTIHPRHRTGSIATAVATVVVLALIAIYFFREGLPGNDRTSAVTAAHIDRSIAVMPFLDLTEEMNQEYFADGMTEELIGKLSKIPGQRVPPLTASFYYKGKQATIGEIAKALGVTYVLDGSVRKSADTLRVTARLIRADDGFVAWSETYDRPVDDILMIQDDIAAEVTKSLSASIDAGSQSVNNNPSR